MYKLLASCLLVVIALACRIAMVRRIRGKEVKRSEFRRRVILQLRNITYLCIFFGLIVIWASELRHVIFSLAAVLVALVLATKELIMCVSGSLLRIGGNAFSLGDRIEVNGIRGDVIDQTLLSTKILEIGPGQFTHQYTGRSVVIPNSVFLNSAVVNETFTEDYVIHLFTIPLPPKQDWEESEQRILSIAQETCAPFLEDARRYFTKLSKREGLAVSSVEPRVTLTLPESEKMNLIVRIPVPARRKGRVEQEILRKFCKAA